MKPDFPGLDPVDAAEWERLARYLAGESPPGEAAAVRSWLDEDPRRRAWVESLDRSLDTLPAGNPDSEIDVEGALATVLAKLDDPKVIPLRPSRASAPTRERRWTHLAIQAAALIVIAVGAAWLYRQLQPPLVTEASRSHRAGVGQQASVRLPDGSHVVLAALSQLVVDEGYGDGARTVALQGEAMFQVEHDETNPFFVLVDGATIEDLGTVFAVRAVGGSVRVAVTEGSVRLGGATASAAEMVTLEAGDRGTLTRGNAPVAQRGVAVDAHLAWTRGELAFDDAPLSEVAEDLRRWHGVDVRFAAPGLADRHLTASFPGSSLEEIVGSIGLALGVEASVRGNTVVLGTAEGGSP